MHREKQLDLLLKRHREPEEDQEKESGGEREEGDKRCRRQKRQSVLNTEKQQQLTDRDQCVANQLEKVVCGNTPCCAECRNYIPVPQQHKVEVCKVRDGLDGNEGLRATTDIQEGEIITMFGE